MIGYVDTKALLWSPGGSIREVMRRGVFYPETRRLPELLLEMNRKGLEVVFLSDEFRGVAGITLRQGYNSTVGGLLCDRLGMIPAVGQVYEEAGFLFRVVQADERHVIRVEITRKDAAGA